MRKSGIERWLTLSVCLCFSGFVAFCVWRVVDSTSQQLVARLFNQSPDGSQATAGQPVVDNHLAVMYLFAASLALLMALIVYYRLLYLRFLECIGDIEAAGGTVRFSNGRRVTMLSYLFGKATVDLSDCDLDDSRLPELSRIPNLVCLRVADNPITKNVLPKIARCRQLGKLDVSGTRIRNEHLEQLHQITGLQAILCE